MHEDREMKALLAQVPIPQPRADLAESIIVTAMGQGAQQRPVAAVHQGGAFLRWWRARDGAYARGLAVAACVAALAYIVSGPKAGYAPQAHKPAQQQLVASQEAAVERYTVNGLPLLADIAFVEEAVFEEETLFFDLAG